MAGKPKRLEQRNDAVAQLLIARQCAGSDTPSGVGQVRVRSTRSACLARTSEFGSNAGVGQETVSLPAERVAQRRNIRAATGLQHPDQPGSLGRGLSRLGRRADPVLANRCSGPVFRS